MEKLTTIDSNSVSVLYGSAVACKASIIGRYHIECIDVAGNIKWIDDADNLIVDQGKNAMLDTYFAGTTYTASWYCSLITSGAVIATSTYITPTVTEVSNTVIGSRVPLAWTVATTGTKTSTILSFPILASATIIGNMIVSGGPGITTVGDTAVSGAILFSSANFNGGPKIVGLGDTLNVSYTISI